LPHHGLAGPNSGTCALGQDAPRVVAQRRHEVDAREQIVGLGEVLAAAALSASAARSRNDTVCCGYGISMAARRSAYQMRSAPRPCW